MQAYEAKKRRYLLESAIQEAKDIYNEDNYSDCTDGETLSTTEEDVSGFESTACEPGVSAESKGIQVVVVRDRSGSGDWPVNYDEHIDSGGDYADLHSDTRIGYDDADWSEGNY